MTNEFNSPLPMPGIDSCKWLLSDGRFQGDKIWQPYGCMMHTYSTSLVLIFIIPKDTRMCLRYVGFWRESTQMAFVGDSRIRQVYLALISHISGQEEVLPEQKKHADTFYENHDMQVRVDFKWQANPDFKMLEVLQKWKEADNAPRIIVLGSATWAIKISNGSLDSLEEYKNNLSIIANAMSILGANGKRIIWMLQDPVIEEDLDPARKMITNEQIDLYNKGALEVLEKHKHIFVWSSSRLITQGLMASTQAEKSDGLHLSPLALKHDTQILLNLYCNDRMNYHDGTCCSSAEPVTTLQKLTLFTLIAFLALAVILFLVKQYTLLKGTRRHYSILPKTTTNGDLVQGRAELSNFTSTFEHYFPLFFSLGKAGVIMAYCFLCDRTNFFMKDNKAYVGLNFWLPIGYLFVVGIFFTEESKFTRILHRDQTDEWKGWMQLVILVYHVTGASKVIPIYMHIRIIVSAYLFLSGYGHFTYFWLKGDCSFIRFCKVMFRMNFLVVVLCLTMNRPYQFYYFVPLISFWYLVIYVFLVIPPQVFFERVFVTRPWKALFVTTDDDIHEWWFRWKLDRYSIAFGMVYAFAYQMAQRHNFLDDGNHSNLWSRGVALTVTFLSIIGLGGFSTFTLLCQSKPECNEIHSYIVFIPIVAFLLLRNISGVLRTQYSRFFAWFGQISLELFVIQYHIWLAADTYGVLVLLPGFPVANILLTSFLFVCAAHEMHSITNALVPYVVPEDWKYTLRNVLIFILILIPIGIHDGIWHSFQDIHIPILVTHSIPHSQALPRLSSAWDLSQVPSPSPALALP
ncbi:unnamed protein product, partial [Darwinula stevensoni]